MSRRERAGRAGLGFGGVPDGPGKFFTVRTLQFTPLLSWNDSWPVDHPAHCPGGLDGSGTCSTGSVRCHLGRAVVWHVPDLGLP